MEEPLFVKVECQNCWNVWDGFFPNGLNEPESTPIECPKCRELNGMCIPINPNGEK